ncbi:MAG: sugar phosphate isomerase/epimerase [Gammaproteobacteria bacterium]|uniref:sugar phosphate isomerase/epimerase family protein n=1 Tax=unclassified Halomonas TaxID=2609666 RepID=UPI000F5D641E|nr:MULTISPECIES: sugar phosphate isomerase/epimerase [unclassified Halomonas]MBR9880077.1 sugar phosphate isomerase/epimerase [Gammaproteobacteria bacterium]MBY6110600.1 sugar phosphate isomerase/epimerase [Halomonas sp. DP1Y21-3]RQW69113.1 sugar phosphate isomerase/epimerase [Halomonas sp. YLB-10]
MKIGLVTDSLANMSLDDLLAFCAEQGIECVEFSIGNWSDSPHLDAAALLDSDAARKDLKARLAHHGVTISAFNANGNSLHPTDGERQHRVVEQAIALSRHFEVPRVNLMSGLPGGGPDDRFPNWVTAAWPPETAQMLDYQWNEVALPYWRKLADHARGEGIRELCLEMHGNQLVYNLPGFLRLHGEIGDIVGLNFDPSHLLWMGADPIEVVQRYARHIYHVHAKDTALNPAAVGLTSRLDNQPMGDFRDRGWSYVTLGYGQKLEWWKDFCYWLQAGGYQDGVLSIEHEDINLSRREGVVRSVELLRACMPSEKPDYELPNAN